MANVAVQVVDKNTNLPVRGAKVALHYSMYRDPMVETIVTGENGVAIFFNVIPGSKKLYVDGVLKEDFVLMPSSDFYGFEMGEPIVVAI